MKIKAIFYLFTMGISVFLTGCGGTGVSVMMQGNAPSAAVPEYAVVVSSHPPKGTYRVLAELSAESDPGENAIDFKRRFQIEGAKIGADYVMFTAGQNNTYTAPAVSNTYSSANGSAIAIPNSDGSVTAFGSANGDSSTYTTPSYNYVRTMVVAQALKMTSGTNEPDMSKPSNLLPYYSKPTSATP